MRNGDKLLVSHRRLFSEDLPRFFLGTVEDYEDGVASVLGHSWVRDVLKGEFLRKDDQRNKIVSLTSGNLIIYKLPRSVDLDAITIQYGPNQEQHLTDGAEFRMDITDRRSAGG